MLEIPLKSRVNVDRCHSEFVWKSKELVVRLI